MTYQVRCDRDGATADMQMVGNDKGIPVGWRAVLVTEPTGSLPALFGRKKIWHLCPGCVEKLDEFVEGFPQAQVVVAGDGRTKVPGTREEALAQIRGPETVYGPERPCPVCEKPVSEGELAGHLESEHADRTNVHGGVDEEVGGTDEKLADSGERVNGEE